MKFEIFFTDNTLLEANGEYQEVCNIMSKETKAGIVTLPVVKEWVLASTVTIQSEFGFASVKCDFYHDGKVIITDHMPSTRDLYCPDIRCLRTWAEAYGWASIEPTEYAIDASPDFWKNQWDTYIIDSVVLDKRHGERSDMMFEDEILDDPELEDLDL